MAHFVVIIDRSAVVERDNLILLEKMRQIMVKQQINSQEPFVKDSLNRGARQAEMVRIMNENEALLKRIQTRTPVIDTGAMERDHVAKEKLLYNIGHFPYQSATGVPEPERRTVRLFSPPRRFTRPVTSPNGTTSNGNGNDGSVSAPGSAGLTRSQSSSGTSARPASSSSSSSDRRVKDKLGIVTHR
jgi:hypothetical protein